MADGIQAKRDKMSTQTFLMPPVLLAEFNSISVTGHTLRIRLPAVIDPPGRSIRPDRLRGYRTTSVPDHPGRILGAYFPNAGKDIRSLFRFSGRGIQAHPCSTMRTKFCRSYRCPGHRGSAAHRATGIP